MNININEIGLLKSIIKTCDLIFITIPQNSPNKNGYISTINNEKEICIHVGILKNDSNEEEIKIIEADTIKGVNCSSLKLFIEKSLKSNPLKRFYIKRIKNSNETDIKRWIVELEKHIGKKYNSYYAPTKDLLYNSELIHAIFKDKNGEYLFNEIPMNFKNEEGKYDSYWIDYFKNLNMDIPQGKIGTDPDQIMKNEILEQISEIQNKENISYSFYEVENDNEVFNETKKALMENNTDIWTQFEKKLKMAPNYEVIGTRTFINGEFKEYKFMKMFECFKLAEEIANGLAYIGLKENDTVLELMNQRIEVPIINMAIWRQGGIIAPKSQGNINNKDYIQQIEPTLVILTPEYIQLFYEDSKQLKTENKLKVKNVLILNYPNGPDQDKEILNDDIIKKFKNLGMKIHRYNDIINIGKTKNFQRKNINPDNIAFIISSSGTSQTNIKLICLSHKNAIATSVIHGVFIKGLGEYKLLMHAAFGHASDCLDNVCAMTCPYFCLGYSSNGQNSYFEDIKLLKPNANYLIPLTLKKLYDEYNLKIKAGMSKQNAKNFIINEKLGGNIKYVNCFGCGLSKEITDWCIDDLKFKFSNYYGATEAVFIFAEILKNSNKPSNYISNKPKYVEIRIKEIEKNDKSFIIECNEGNMNYKIIRGELLVKSENVMMGYYNNKELTDKVLDKDNYYHTGDVVEYNTNTNDIILVDRLNNMIVLSNAAKVPSSFLENSILNNPLFKQCCVYGNENDIKLFCIVVLNKDILKKEFDNYEKDYQQIYEKVLIEMNNVYEKNKFPPLWKFNKIIIEFNEWTLEDGLITISGKIIRKAIIEKYKDKFT